MRLVKPGADSGALVAIQGNELMLGDISNESAKDISNELPMGTFLKSFDKRRHPE